MQNDLAVDRPGVPKGCQVIEDYVTQEDGSLQFVLTTRADIGCCSHEIVREYWDEDEITAEMRRRDIKEIGEALNTRLSRHSSKCRLKMRFTVHRLCKDRMTSEQRRNDDHLQRLLSSLMYGA